MKNPRTLWLTFIIVVTASFIVLSYYGYELYHKAPPIPQKIVTTEGKQVFTATDIKDGQNVWQSIGGQEVGSIWGHGSYVAPDWTADWLHREALHMLNRMSDSTYQKPYDDILPEQKAFLEKKLQLEIRKNTYDPNTGTISV